AHRVLRRPRRAVQAAAGREAEPAGGRGPHRDVRAEPAARLRGPGTRGLLVGRGFMAMSQAVLVLRALGLGDLLTAVPALRRLSRAFPDDRLVLAAPAGLRDLVELIDAVDELLPTAGLGALNWPGPPPKLAVNLHGRGPESIRDLLAQHPAELLTHRHPAFAELPGARWRADVHERDRWCGLLEFARIPADPADFRLPA